MEEFQQTAKLVEQEVAPEGSEMQASMCRRNSPESWELMFSEIKIDGFKVPCQQREMSYRLSSLSELVSFSSHVV